jgi:hypothetical protein
MNKRACLVAAVVIGAATCGAAPAVLAQDSTSMTVNGTTITFGGGGQYLSLPDIKFTGVGRPGRSVDKRTATLPITVAPSAAASRPRSDFGAAIA